MKNMDAAIPTTKGATSFIEIRFVFMTATNVWENFPINIAAKNKIVCKCASIESNAKKGSSGLSKLLSYVKKMLALKISFSGFKDMFENDLRRPWTVEEFNEKNWLK